MSAIVERKQRFRNCGLLCCVFCLPDNHANIQKLFMNNVYMLVCVFICIMQSAVPGLKNLTIEIPLLLENSQSV